MSRVQLIKQLIKGGARTCISRNYTAATINNTWGIEEIIVGDSKEAWQNAGFNVDEENLVKLNNLNIRVTGSGTGLSGIVFGYSDNSGADSNNLHDPPIVNGLSVFAQEQTKHKADPKHPNTCLQLGELVLYAQNLHEMVAQLQKAGIKTDRDRPPREMKGGKHAIATFYLSNNLRLLLFGPTDPKHDRSTNPKVWMFGRGVGDAPVELTGYLPVCDDLKKLHASVTGEIGEIKKAVQKGRQITTLKDGAIENLTGTFAFLSNGEGALF